MKRLILSTFSSFLVDERNRGIEKKEVSVYNKEG